MKNIFLTSMLALFVFSSCEKGIDKESVPAPVKEAFGRTFPDIQEVEWENRHSKYVAKFKKDGEEVEIEYSANGTLLGTDE